MIIRVLFTISILSSICLADDAYSWKDQDGRSFYGTKPPSEAISVERVPDGNISVYDSSKVLGVSEAGKVAETVKRAKLREPKEVSEATLSSTKPACVIEESELVQCSLSVENTGSTNADNVRVQIKFTDGTSMPLKGPKKLLAKAKVLYIAPESLLPLALDVPADETPEVVLRHD